jgi:hypothetical protein
MVSFISSHSGCTDHLLCVPEFEKAITTQQIIRPYLARSLLDWEPKKPGLTDGLSLYWSAYLAHVE